MVIIRQKPEAISARDYTIRLAQNFEKEEMIWRRRARQLEDELLRMRQEVIVRYQLQERGVSTGVSQNCGFFTLFNKLIEIKSR